MASLMLWLGIVSYGAAALLYGVAAIIVAASQPGSRRATLLAAAIAFSSIWAVGLAVSVGGVSLSPPILIGFDAVHLFAWTTCVLSWLGPLSVRTWLVRASAVTGLLAIAASWSYAALSLGVVSYPALVLMALIGFLALEQVYRNAQEEARRHLNLLCLAAGGNRCLRPVRVLACRAPRRSAAASLGGTRVRECGDASVDCVRGKEAIGLGARAIRLAARGLLHGQPTRRRRLPSCDGARRLRYSTRSAESGASR